MIKKLSLLFAFLLASVFIKAQVTLVKEPSNEVLTEEKISKILDETRKSGVKEWEIEVKKKVLYGQKGQPITNQSERNKNQIPPHINASSCVNPGFEDSTMTGWTFLNGQICSGLGTSLPCNTCPNAAGGVESLIVGPTANAGACTPNASGYQSVAGSDYYSGLSTLAPGGGNVSLLLNDACTGGKIQKATYSFVTNASTNIFTFQYAVVLQSGGHAANAQPYFHVDATDITTGLVINCTQYDATAPSSGALNGWSISPQDASVYTYPWKSVALDLSAPAYNGHTIKVSFVVSDCNACGHFGYCYIDASCSSNLIQLTKGLCAGGGPAILSGPPGFATYQWVGPVTANTQTLSTSTAGSYTLNTTSSTTCPSPSMFYTLTTSPQPVPAFSTSSPPCSGSVTFTDGSTVPTGSITNWVWNYGDGSPSVNATTAANQSHSYAIPGPYTVTLRDTTDNKCSATYTLQINAGGGGPTAIFSSNSPATAPQCLTGNNVVFTNSSTATGSVTITGYTWDYGDGSGTITSTTTTPNPPNHTYAAAGTYVVTLTVNVTGCSTTTTQTVVINPMPTATISVPAVCLGTTSVFASTVTNGNTYAWNFGGAGTGTNITTATPTYSYSASGNYPVTLTVTSVGGCTVTATTTATVTPNPTATISVAEVCQGTSSAFTSTVTNGNTYSWNFGGAGVGSNVTTATPGYVYASSGTFPVTVLVTAVGGCTVTAATTATVDAMPVLSFNTAPACDLSAVSITNTTPAQGTFTVWAWTMGDGVGTSAAAAPGSYTYPGPGIYTITLTASTATGCSGTVTATATVHPNPVPDFTGFLVCNGDDPGYTDLSTITNPAGINDVIITWSWAFGDGGTSTLPSPSYTYATCGVYSPSLTVTSNFSCTATAVATETVFCLPTVTAPPSFSICPGKPVASAQTTFTTTCASPAFGTPAAIVFVNNPNPTNNTTSTHGGIPLADTVDVDAIPNYNAIAQNLSCGLLVDTIYGYAVTAIGNGTVTCVGNFQTFTISVYPTPTVTPVSNQTVCAATNVAAVNFTGCPAGETFPWVAIGDNVGLTSPGSGNIASFPGQNPVTPAAAVSTVSVTPVANGCSGPPITFNITVNPIPTMTVTSPPPYCPSDLISSTDYNFNTNIVGPGLTYSWTTTPPNNTGMQLAGTGLAPATPYNAPANASLVNQTSVISYTPSMNGCIGPVATNTITIKPTPVIQPISDVFYCPNQVTNQINFACQPTGQGTPNYNWIITTAPYNVGLAPSAGTQSFVPAFTTNANNTGIAQSGNVTLGASLNNCPSTFSNFAITVYPTPIPKFSYTKGVCEGQSMLFTDLSKPNTGPITVTQWNWDMNNDGLYTDATTQNPQFAVTPAGLDSVGLIVFTNSNPSCWAVVKEAVYVNPNPVADFAGDSLKRCPKLYTNFKDLSTVALGANITSYNWTLGNGNTSTSSAPAQQTYTNSSPIQSAYYSVSLTVKTDSGCVNTKTKNNYIQVYPRPIADFGWGPVGTDIDAPTIDFVNQSIGASGYPASQPIVYGAYGVEYYLGDVFAMNQNSNNVYNNAGFAHTYEYYEPYTYYVTQWVINSMGCKDSITKPVEILPNFTFYIPNAFSPNGDGANEGFKGTGVGIDNTTYNLWVFDRWGMMIFYADDLEKSWDGHMKGNADKPILQEDVYVWKVKFNDFRGKKHEYHGTVTLLK
jgi:gliding motility-associated-like protein